jgi:2-amino-4-hydroxy-6-hydroxymethyldihydropteridine diphosphokinase
LIPEIDFVSQLPLATVYLALGANIGDRLASLQAALSALPAWMHHLVCSPVYETQPWGYTDQPAFLNQAVSGETRLTPEDLLFKLKSLETSLGRTPTFRNGPRRIDIDILMYADRVLDTPTLVLPHPRLGERAFVLVPLADIAPDVVPPRLDKSVRDLLAEVDRTGVELYKNGVR